jgi:hypothetical protein
VAQARFVVSTLLIALASCTPRTETDVARAMCEKNISCANFSDDVEACTARVSATMPPASCSAAELQQCEDDIAAEPCTAPEARLPLSCGVCE